MLHNPVLLNETIELLAIQKNGTYVDATAGFGGHAKAILSKLNAEGKLVCIDQDLNAINELKKIFNEDKRVNIIHGNFASITLLLKQINIQSVNGIIADLGVSSPMFDEASRGFSFHKDGILDMRMNTLNNLTAKKVVNTFNKKQLVDIFSKYGEIKNSHYVVDAIIKNRPINTTNQLVEIIKNNVSKKTLFEKKHPARLYFQALRIYVNDELNCLKEFLPQSLGLLSPGGICAIISYHSLEDKIVKKIFSEYSTSKIPSEIPIKNEFIPYKIINPKGVRASEQEILENRRARTAILRGIKRRENV